jgi:hypothetical protein
VRIMKEKKFRRKVVAEITLAHLTKCAQELGRTLTTEEALDFLNQNGRAYEMWKRMMQAGEEYMKSAANAHSRTHPANGHRSRPDSGVVVLKG